MRRLAYVLAALLVTGLLAVATPARADHGDWHQLQLVSLTCYLNNDPSGDDEPYIKLNGGKIWENPDCSPITTYDLRAALGPTWFFDPVEIVVMEEDPWSPDDFIGRVTISTDQAGTGVQLKSFLKQTGAGILINYELEYEVI